MLYWLGFYLKDFFGPFRLLTSHLILAGIGIILCWFLSWRLLPGIAEKFLPRDRGRQFAVDSSASKGKPTGAGVIFITIFIIVSLLVVPFSMKFLIILACIGLTMLAGYLDDKSISAWGEYTKGIVDLVLAAIASVTLYNLDQIQVWLPLYSHQIPLPLPPYIFIPAAIILIWTAINTTNCTDGVDGLSGSLIIIALICLGAMLYFILGHSRISEYLLLPHYKDGARWAIMTFAMVGSLAGYLWYNAHPSSLLMGDAGSRAIGFLLGVLVIVTGNPFIIFIVAGVLLVNGGTGLLKVALLRFFKIRIFHNIRFPLHDHFRHNKGWSNMQVIIRFVVIQFMLIIILTSILIKIR